MIEGGGSLDPSLLCICWSNEDSSDSDNSFGWIIVNRKRDWNPFEGWILVKPVDREPDGKLAGSDADGGSRAFGEDITGTILGSRLSWEDIPIYCI